MIGVRNCTDSKVKLTQHLLGKPGATGLSDPLSGVDSSVHPDGGAVVPSSAELGHGEDKDESRQGIKIEHIYIRWLFLFTLSTFRGRPW